MQTFSWDVAYASFYTTFFFLNLLSYSDFPFPHHSISSSHKHTITVLTHTSLSCTHYLSKTHTPVHTILTFTKNITIQSMQAQTHTFKFPTHTTKWLAGVVTLSVSKSSSKRHTQTAQFHDRISTYTPMEER